MTAQGKIMLFCQITAQIVSIYHYKLYLCLAKLIKKG